MSEWGEAGLCVTRSRRDERKKAQLVYLFCGKLVLESASDISVLICIEKSIFLTTVLRLVYYCRWLFKRLQLKIAMSMSSPEYSPLPMISGRSCQDGEIFAAPSIFSEVFGCPKKMFAHWEKTDMSGCDLQWNWNTLTFSSLKYLYSSESV